MRRQERWGGRRAAASAAAPATAPAASRALSGTRWRCKAPDPALHRAGLRTSVSKGGGMSYPQEIQTPLALSIVRLLRCPCTHALRSQARRRPGHWTKRRPHPKQVQIWYSPHKISGPFLRWERERTSQKPGVPSMPCVQTWAKFPGLFLQCPTTPPEALRLQESTVRVQSLRRRKGYLPGLGGWLAPTMLSSFSPISPQR